MAVISPKALSAVVEIATQTSDQGKDPEYPVIGTGFLYGLKADDEGGFTFLVTAKHVVRGEKSIWLRFNTKDGAAGLYEEAVLEKDSVRYAIEHPSGTADVAVYPMDISYLRKLGLEDTYIRSDLHAMDRQEAAKAGLQEGDGIIVLGFPLGLSGTVRKSVTARGGIIARFQDFLLDHDAYFLIDSHAFPGNSGGPVFNVPEVSAVEGTACVNRSCLIGLVAEYLKYEDRAYSEQTKELRAVFVENSGLAVVEPVDHINETINHAVQELTKIGLPPR